MVIYDCESLLNYVWDLMQIVEDNHTFIYDSTYRLFSKRSLIIILLLFRDAERREDSDIWFFIL